MIYVLLFWEFFKIGLFAVGGGLVTVPFLFDLAEKYPWFTTRELTDMIAISQSTPGPVGINMATFAGYKAAGVWGALTATLGEILPSVIIICLIAKLLTKWSDNQYVNRVLSGIRPAVLVLILLAGWDIAKEAVSDYKTFIITGILLLAMRLWRKSVIIYIIAAAFAGIMLKL